MPTAAAATMIIDVEPKNLLHMVDLLASQYVTVRHELKTVAMSSLLFDRAPVHMACGRRTGSVGLPGSAPRALTPRGPCRHIVGCAVLDDRCFKAGVLINRAK